MEAHEDAQLRLAAFRHPAARVASSLHLAQRQLGEAARAFATVMAAAGEPGAQHLPPPGGRGRWPRGHAGRQVLGWAVPAEVDESFQCWIDTAGGWWMVRFDERGDALDAHPVGTPLHRADDLATFQDGLEQILRAGRVPH